MTQKFWLHNVNTKFHVKQRKIRSIQLKYLYQFSHIMITSTFIRISVLRYVFPWHENWLDSLIEIGRDVQYTSPTLTWHWLSSQGLLSDWEILAMEETILSANLFRKDENRLKWKVEASDPSSQSQSQHNIDSNSSTKDDLSITLKPMEIRTFILTVQKASARF